MADVKAENEGNSHETCEPHSQEKDEQTVQKPIWNHFLKQSGTFRAICKHCLLELSIRDGRRSSSINTTAIKRHLQAKHPKEFRKFKGKKNKNIYLIVFILVSSQSYLFAVEDYKMAGMTARKPVLDLGPSPFSREELLRRVANITNDRFRQDTIPGRVRNLTKEIEGQRTSENPSFRMFSGHSNIRLRI